MRINKSTVISVLKNKASSLDQVNPKIVELSVSSELGIRLEGACIEAELDEQWSWVGKKFNQRWLWPAVEGFPQAKALIVIHKYKNNRHTRMDAGIQCQGW